MKENFAVAALRSWGVALCVIGSGLTAPAFAGQLRLVMFDQPGCIYCAQWEAEIGPIYPVTDEAKTAPLTHIGIRDALPKGVELDRPVTLTPTFVLLDDGHEAGRIEGYPGEDFFWFLLGELIDVAGEAAS